MKKIGLITLLIFLASCKDFYIGDKKLLTLSNNSNQNIVGYKGFVYEVGSMYPDTTFPNIPTDFKERIIMPKNSTVLIGGRSLDDIFEKLLPNGILSIYVFNADTLEKHPLDTIKSRYLVLQRYDLSLQDIKHRQNIIEFPYDSTRGELKVYRGK